jgi:hypothetical protein
MRSAVSFVMMLSLTSSAAPAFAQHRPGPIARSLAAEAAMLAARHADNDARADAAWMRLREVARGTHVVVVLNDGRSLRTHFVDVDESSLEVSAPASRLLRANVLEVREGESRGSVDGAWAGALGGGALGLWLTLLAANKPCYPNCGPEKAAIGFSLVGIPVGLGFAGYYGLRHRPEVLYRAN